MKSSPAMRLVELVVRYEGFQQGKSWDRTNHAADATIQLAIEYGVQFYVDDFEMLAKHIAYSGAIELFYAKACGSERGRQNMTAARSFEKWRGRKPFLVREHPGVTTPTRVYVGFDFWWYGERVTVTSFKDDAESPSFTACSYKPRTDDEYERKIDKRHSITHAMIRDYHQSIEGWKKIAQRLKPASQSVTAKINDWIKKKFKVYRTFGLTLKQLAEVNAKLDKMIGTDSAKIHEGPEAA